MPISFRWVWSISIKFSPLMLFSVLVSRALAWWAGGRTFEEVDILGAIDADQPLANLCLVPMSVHVSMEDATAGKGQAHLIASGASYVSENSDSVGEAKSEVSVLDVEP